MLPSNVFEANPAGTVDRTLQMKQTIWEFLRRPDGLYCVPKTPRIRIKVLEETDIQCANTEPTDRDTERGSDLCGYSR